MKRLSTSLLLILLAAPALRATGPKIGIVPFQNHNGNADAVAIAMPEVEARLEQLGFTVAGNGRVEDFLRKNRIRDHHAVSAEHAAEIARTIGARYLLLGTIDALHLNDGPEVGLTARIIDAETGQVAWANSVGVHAVDVAGVLAMGRPETLEEATDKAVRRLFRTVKVREGEARFVSDGGRPERGRLADPPILYLSDELRRRRGMRVAVLPFVNLARRPDASMVLADHLTSVLLQVPEVEVVEPGELRRVLIEQEIQPLYGVTARQLEILGEALDADYVLDGTVLVYDDRRGPPRIDLFGRLRRIDTGRVVWSATTTRDGDQTRTVYDLGRISGIERLARAAVEDLLSTWFR